MRKLGTLQKMLLEHLKDPECAQVYLEVALEDYDNYKDLSALVMAVRDVVEAQGRLNNP